MGKKIKFPLEMKDGYKVRTMEELRIHSDVESIIEYFLNGKLRNWLKDRYYQEEINAIDELEISNDNLIERIYSILHLKKEIDDNVSKVEKIIRQQDIRSKIKQYTDDEEILNNIDCVATSQEEFESVLEEKRSIAYLLGEKFMIFDNIKNIIIKGINNPEVIVNSKGVIDFKERQVYFENCHFDLEYESLIEKKRLEEENSHKKKKNTYKSSNIFDDLLSDKDRNESAKIFAEIQNNLQSFDLDINFERGIDEGLKEILTVLENEDIQDKFNIDKYCIEIKSEQMKLKKFETIITDLLKKFKSFKGEEISNKNPLKYLFGETSNNKYAQIILDKSFNEEVLSKNDKKYYRCSYKWKSDTEKELVEACRCCNKNKGSLCFESKCNLSNQLIFFALLFIAVENYYYNDKINIISNIAYLIGFNKEMMSDWVYAVKSILDMEKIDFYRFKSEEAKKFFEVLK